MPYGIVQFIFIIADDTHANMGYEIVRHSHQNTLKNIRGIPITACFQKGFSQKAVRVNMHRKGLEDILAMSNCLIQLATFDHAFYLTVVNT
ncbi:MAG: hypothetical protein ABSA23_05130 [Anaerolineales bacterium]